LKKIEAILLFQTVMTDTKIKKKKIIERIEKKKKKQLAQELDMRTTTSVAVRYIEFSKVTGLTLYVNNIEVTTRISVRLIDIGKDVVRRVLI